MQKVDEIVKRNFSNLIKSKISNVGKFLENLKIKKCHTIFSQCNLFPLSELNQTKQNDPFLTIGILRFSHSLKSLAVCDDFEQFQIIIKESDENILNLFDCLILIRISNADANSNTIFIDSFENILKLYEFKHKHIVRHENDFTEKSNYFCIDFQILDFKLLKISSAKQSILIAEIELTERQENPFIELKNIFPVTKTVKFENKTFAFALQVNHCYEIMIPKQKMSEFLNKIASNDCELMFEEDFLLTLPSNPEQKLNHKFYKECIIKAMKRIQNSINHANGFYLDLEFSYQNLRQELRFFVSECHAISYEHFTVNKVYKFYNLNYDHQKQIANSTFNSFITYSGECFEIEKSVGNIFEIFDNERKLENIFTQNVYNISLFIEDLINFDPKSKMIE